MNTPLVQGRIAESAADPGHFQALADWCRGTQVLGILLALTFVSFTALAVAAHNEPYFPVDLTMTRAVQGFQSESVDRFAELVSWPGFPPQSNIFFGAIVLVMLVARRVFAALCEVVAAGGSAALWFAIAPLVDRPRPSPELVNVSMYIPFGSFPSGHVLNFTAGLGFAWYIAYTLLPRSLLRTGILWVLPVFLLVLGLSRIYSGQHWPSDVLGGYLLGALWLWLIITVYRQAPATVRDLGSRWASNGKAGTGRGGN